MLIIKTNKSAINLDGISYTLGASVTGLENVFEAQVTLKA